MNNVLCTALSFLVISVLSVAQPTAEQDHQLNWRPWSDAVFAEARQEHRFVLLDLEAVWCHWCHVMDQTTYRDPAVIRLLQSRYILVKVDQDSRPDLSNRYEDYGWPATIVFDASGHEIVKRQGYLPPELMASMLEAIIRDPSPGPSVRRDPKIESPQGPHLSAAIRQQLSKNYLDGYDQQQGSWGMNQKLLDWDSVEYSMALWAKNNDVRAERMARKTLSGQLSLLDPAWGGVYQYSAGGDWNSPHFEKIMQMQAENLRIYSLAYGYWHDPVHLHAAQEIRRYLKTFLTSPDGGLYTSQDADLVDGQHSADYFALDDAQRRKLGTPRVDTHMYARENGWAIRGLVALYAATGDRDVLEDALHAARWVLANRSIPGGGFYHGANDAAGPYLGDNAAMASALVALYRATADRKWLDEAEVTTTFIDENFSDPGGVGFLTSKVLLAEAIKPKPQRDENVLTARTANLLFQYTGKRNYQRIAQQAMRFLAAFPIVYRRPASSVLLTDLELSSGPLHLTVVGPKTDPAAGALFQAALRYPSTYERLEWWDRTEGSLPSPDVQYPELNAPAAFVCTDRTCSSPIFRPEELRARVDKIAKRQKPVNAGTISLHKR